jgi:DNA topoisomerase-1
MLTNGLEINISQKQIQAAINDAELSAKAVNLIYVNAAQPGISRKKNGKSFSYYNGNKKICDDASILRIKKLAIPPAWSSVWICCQPNGHLQVTGLDARNRK